MVGNVDVIIQRGARRIRGQAPSLRHLLPPRPARSLRAGCFFRSPISSRQLGGRRQSRRGHRPHRILVCRNHAEYPPAAGKPAYVRDDLMVTYREVKPTATKAAYFDSAGYTRATPSPRALPARRHSRAMSSRASRAIACRILCCPTDASTTTIEVSPAGKKDAFGPYLQWTSKRVAASAQP